MADTFKGSGRYRAYTPPRGFLTLAMACKRLRVSRVKLRTMLAERGIREHTDPRDKRQVLLRAEDVERLTGPDALVPRVAGESRLARRLAHSA